jgi:Fe-S-cluster containining protein
LLIFPPVSYTKHMENWSERDNWQRKSGEHRRDYKRLLERGDRKAMLENLPELHTEAFSKISCLDCAGCCTGYSPRFKTPDIKRISKHLRMKEGAFIEKFLRIDEEGDFVLQSLPCPFLGQGNACTIYEDRPSDCRRFPYTDEDVFFKRPAITLKNSEFCPAVYYVLERMRSLIQKT